MIEDRTIFKWDFRSYRSISLLHDYCLHFPFKLRLKLPNMLFLLALFALCNLVHSYHLQSYANVVISVIDSGAMTLIGASDKNIYITGVTFSVPTVFTEGNDYYSDSASNTVLSALGSNDTIIERYWYSSISGGAGNETVSLGSDNNIYVYESGNDLLERSRRQTMPAA